jgi:hypothetical protein
MAALRAASAFLFTVAACSHDWDAYDPRLGTTGGDGGGGASPTTTTSSATISGSTSGTTTSSSTSSTGGGGQGPGEVTYTAAVADCVGPTMPNPDTCETEVGAGTMTVDTEYDPPIDLTARQSYLRFDLDGTLAGKTIDGATLRVRVTAIMGAESNQTGELWQVQPFTRSDLFVATPAPVGASPIAADQGPVALSELVSFAVPTSLISPNGSVFLGLLPLTTNGVDYYNANGAEPPVLVVDYH